MAATVRDVYVSQVVRITPQTMLADAEQELLSGSGDHAYVVDDAGRLVGVVPDYELLKLRMLNLHDVGAAVDVMTPGPPAVTLETPLEEAACHLRVHVHRSLPVLEDGRLVGRVERRSILNWYRCAAARGESAAHVAAHSSLSRPKFLNTGAGAASRSGVRGFNG